MKIKLKLVEKNNHSLFESDKVLKHEVTGKPSPWNKLKLILSLGDLYSKTLDDYISKTLDPQANMDISLNKDADELDKLWNKINKTKETKTKLQNIQKEIEEYKDRFFKNKEFRKVLRNDGLTQKLSLELEPILQEFGLSLIQKSVSSDKKYRPDPDKGPVKYNVPTEPTMASKYGSDLEITGTDKYPKRSLKKDLEKDDWGEYKGDFTPDDWSDWDDDIEKETPSSWDEPDEDDIIDLKPDMLKSGGQDWEQRFKNFHSQSNKDYDKEEEKRKTIKLVTDKIKQKRQQAKDRANKSRVSRAEPVIKQTRKKH